ncbi:eukaryotic integral membrane protein-domain-containing protein [Amylocarpus encephaloides]|uniref:Eukaryotic integral membrane protein-domain-containing protein n=1 Tax=Amylocarpus encephaloides TaxID=45428 RepID=A0A9P7YE30_9HELO|nr:eukaryotic integral membrane protein-domain-containing protein [Amylocarpus encephaloides]
MPPRLNIPPITRILLILLAFNSLLSAAIRYRQWNGEGELLVPYLVLVPQLSLIYPWTFVTTTLVENNVFTFAIGAITVFYGGRYLERAWSSREFVKFLVVGTLVPNLMAFVMLVAMFAVTGNVEWTLTSINGTIPLQIAFLVAFSQLLPSHTVTLFKGIISLRVPRLPLLHTLLVLALSLTPLLSTASFILVTTGFLTSWTYLRFYKHTFADLETAQPSTLRGDSSETFAFAEFFPEPVKPFVAGVSSQVYNTLVTLKICAPFSHTDLSTSRGESTVQRGTPGSARAEAERRRALALKALDQRLQVATAAATMPKPPPPTVAGPSVQIQPQPNVQTPETMLGETNYVPEREEEGKN